MAVREPAGGARGVDPERGRSFRASGSLLQSFIHLAEHPLPSRLAEFFDAILGALPAPSLSWGTSIPGAPASFKPTQNSQELAACHWLVGPGSSLCLFTSIFVLGRIPDPSWPHLSPALFP